MYIEQDLIGVKLRSTVDPQATLLPLFEDVHGYECILFRQGKFHQMVRWNVEDIMARFTIDELRKRNC